MTSQILQSIMAHKYISSRFIYISNVKQTEHILIKESYRPDINLFLSNLNY